MTANTESGPMFDDLVRYLTPVEIAYALSKTVRTINLWLADPNHPLKGQKVGRSWRVHPDDFKRFMQEGQGK